jgi:membrane-bound lytic murein transglycosylase D
MVMASIIIAKNPTQYGFELAPVTRPAFEMVTVPDAINLGTVAEWTGVSVDAIRELNPELRRATTPLGKHDLRVPLGTGPTVEAELAKADPTVFASAQFKWHFVAKGETLRTIAAKYKVTTSKLAQANDMKTTSKVRVGQRLMVPTTITAPSTLAAAKPPAKPGAAPPIVATTPKPLTPRPAPATTTYRVQPGDTLTAIAKQFDMTVAELKTLNRLSSDRITPGDRLTVRK